MNAYGQASLEGTGWRMGIDDAFLDGPGAPSRCCRSPTERQGSVLVPHYQPVRMMRLLESVAWKGLASGPKIVLAIVSSLACWAKIGECWISQGVADASPTASQRTLSERVQ